MTYLSDFVSNTSAAGGNQYIFSSDQQVEKGRVFYRLTHPGSYHYRLCFSGTVDSTFADGSVSRCNLECPDWKLLRCRVAVCAKDSIGVDFMEANAAENINNCLSDFRDLTFSGYNEIWITGTDPIYSDPILLHAETDDYLCIEIEFQGSMLPYHEESLLPVYRYSNGSWIYDKRVPLPCTVACDRPVKARIGFWGDSITQGIGTVPNSYRHWCALAAKQLSDDYACWNLGLGYGRASDAASNGIWMRKALENDIVCACFGVNDILQGAAPEALKQSLIFIVQKLKSHGKTVLLQTIPPFDYEDEHRRIWHDVNNYIRREMSGIADAIFDNGSVLSLSAQELHKAKYGGHPNEEGCALWAEALLIKLREMLNHGGYL